MWHLIIQTTSEVIDPPTSVDFEYTAIVERLHYETGSMPLGYSSMSTPLHYGVGEKIGYDSGIRPLHYKSEDN